MNDYLALLVSIACAGGRAGIFVLGTVGIAGALQISAGTTAAFG
jgi:hypothetical protein